ncbi:YeiH family protein [Natronomonas marina]|jgi:uncharacterized integral membrane protein (TIGR00698 family)|uniref:YeiH family protein n=1 Tax=Natronomonas marina TaxID=2961939 RepID=UPI0020C99E8F|nr:putative sulfate exporter family transporter [Natronomonas marina]
MKRSIIGRFGGILVLVIVAGAALVVGSKLPVLTPLVLAIAGGAVVSNTVSIPEGIERGIAVHPLFLETAIVLLGASLPLSALVAAGPLLIGLVVGTVALGVVVVTGLSRFAHLNDRLESLLAAGSSICGVSAIAAVAPVVEADDTQIAHAAATILLFDVLTLVLFPPIGRLLGVEAKLYGIWIGLAMFSTGPVAAAGFAHSTVAGQWAMLTKLSRNALIGILVVLYSLLYANRERTQSRSVGTTGRLWAEFPKFLVGFVLLAVLANSGLLSDRVIDTIGLASDALFLLAFAGLGFEIRLRKIRQSGVAPIAVVGLYLVFVSSVTYLAVGLFF